MVLLFELQWDYKYPNIPSENMCSTALEPKAHVGYLLKTASELDSDTGCAIVCFTGDLQ